MREYSLLIGNGINNISAGNSWLDVLNDLESKYKIKTNTKDKPFPLAYEEIYLSILKLQGDEFTESEIKRSIANKINMIKPNVIHDKIMNLKCNNIMTTNYDLAFEYYLDGSVNAESLKNEGEVNESKYNVFRHHKINNKKIWHIHGSLSNPNSIILGYEHYSGYLQSMRGYTTTGSNYSNKLFDKPLTERLKTGDTGYSWIDDFFTKDVCIVGLNLDFVEIDLWWLLTFRERCRLMKKTDFNISNTITYYIPKHYYDDSVSKPKIELLRSVGVIVNSSFGSKFIREEKEYYLSVIEHIHAQFSN